MHIYAHYLYVYARAQTHTPTTDPGCYYTCQRTASRSMLEATDVICEDNDMITVQDNQFHSITRRGMRIYCIIPCPISTEHEARELLLNLYFTHTYLLLDQQGVTWDLLCLTWTSYGQSLVSEPEKKKEKVVSWIAIGQSACSTTPYTSHFVFIYKHNNSMQHISILQHMHEMKCLHTVFRFKHKKHILETHCTVYKISRYYTE